jgi:HNH endonuclease
MGGAPNEIDHIDKNRANNAIWNLRAATSHRMVPINEFRRTIDLDALGCIGETIMGNGLFA